MRNCVILRTIIASAAVASALLSTAQAQTLVKMSNDVFTCESLAPTDNWFTQGISCMQADTTSPYKGYIKICSGTECQATKFDGTFEMPSDTSITFSTSPDGKTWTPLKLPSFSKPTVFTLDSAATLKSYTANCTCTEGADPSGSGTLSCTPPGKDKPIQGHYEYCIPGVK